MIKRFQSVSLMLFLMGLGAVSATAATIHPVQMDEMDIVQQTGACTGQVLDANGEPLIGASVVVKGSSNGSTTDANGRFTIAGVKKGATVRVSYIGYTTLDVVFNGESLKVTLQEDASNLDEVVVVGYTTSSKRDLIASVSTVKTEELANLPVSNITQGLAGRSPGLIVTTSGGGPNNSRANISIRGGGAPIYVIDGVIRSADDFANLSSDDIASMSILKDASATAVYGARATNGIVQVVTKSGKAGARPTVEYDFNHSWSQPAIWPKMMHSYEQAYYGNLARQNDGLEPLWSQEAIDKMKNGTDLLNYNDTNWRDVVLNNWAPVDKHTVRVTGGSDVNRFYASFGHVYQNSMIKTDVNYTKRENFRLADQISIKPIGLDINLSLDGFVEKNATPYTSTSSSYYHIFSHVNNKSPMGPAVNQNGEIYNITDHPLAETAKDAGSIVNNNRMVNGRAEGIWNCLWVDGLRVRVATNYRFGNVEQKSWRRDPAQFDWDSTTPVYNQKPYLKRQTTTQWGMTNQAFLEYGNTFGKHTVNALVGYEQYYEKTTGFWASRQDYQFEVPMLNVGSSSTQLNGDDEQELGRKAIIAQAKYSYDGRYYVEGSLRHDGSDYFAPGHRWGNFFGASVGWVVTSEKFMQTLVDRNILNTLKIRASYGETGQDNSAGRFAYLTSYNMNAAGLVVGGNPVPSFSEGALASPDLTWYTTRQTDIGFDFASLRNRLYGSFDYFYYSTKGYLVAPTGDAYVNNILGVSAPKVKSDSEFRRAGYEVQLGWRDNIREFKYDVSANFTWYNTAWALNESESESSYMNPYTRQQQVLQNYYGTTIHSLGLYQSAQDVYSSVAYLNAIATGNLTAGDIKYEDTNGDGRITSADNRRLGKSSTPHGQFGINVKLNWKGWYLTALFQGSARFDMYLEQNGQKTGQNLPVWFNWQTDYWRADNTDALLPRLMSDAGRNAQNNEISSDYWLVNGRYCRLKDFTFGYDFKYSLLKGVNWLTRAKVGISGQNLFTISPATKYGLDPENASTVNYQYPVERTIALSINLGF